jgi:serine/threonine-protein phosphatase PP1 catalytic subunit
MAHIFKEAARLNLTDKCRKGNVVHLPQDSEVIVTGDIHGNRINLSKIIEYANLTRFPDRRLVMHEIIHGPPDAAGQDRSAELLLRAARLKVASPEQVYFVLSNHDVAQLMGNEIMKDGCGYCRKFNEGLAHAFGTGAGEVAAAVKEFLLSLPMAVQSSNGVFMSHSVPSPAAMTAVGTDILSRPYDLAKDFHRGGSAYEWVWGRDPLKRQLDELAAKLGVQFFIVGHKHLNVGCEELHDRGLIVSSEHAQGCIVQFNSDCDATHDFFRPWNVACVKMICKLIK